MFSFFSKNCSFRPALRFRREKWDFAESKAGLLEIEKGVVAMRGRKTDVLILKAVRLLDGHMEPLEIGHVLGLPKRTTYDLLKQVREEVAQEEAARRQAEAEDRALREQEKLDRQKWEAGVLSRLRQEQEQISQPVGSFSGRRFRS